MKKYFLFIFLFLVFILLGCEKKKFEITVHEKDNILIAPLETRTIKASFEFDMELEWTLIDNGYSPFKIDVSPDTRSAKITGVYDGEAILNISAKGYPKVKKEIKVFVNTNPEIFFTSERIIKPGEEKSIISGANPSFIKEDLQFSSSDEKLATVNSLGIVKAISPGVATIYATSKSTGVSGKVTIFVAGPYKIDIFGKSEVVVGEDNLYTSQIYDRNSNQEVEWSISDSEYGIINKEGLLRTIKSGTFKIYATSVENNKLIGELEITTVEKPSKISINLPSTIYKGDIIDLKTIVEPKIPTKDLLITSGNHFVISINEASQLVAVSWGSTVITVTSLIDGNIYATKYIKVEDSSFLNVKGDDILTIGRPSNFSAFLFENKTSDVIWEVSDESIARVDSSGKVTPIRTGSFILKAVNKLDNNIFGTKQVKVYDIPTQVSYIGATSLPKNSRTEVIIDAININGNLVDSSEFIISSSNTEVVSIETKFNKNYLYAIRDGIVTITILSNHADISITQEISVTSYNGNKDTLLVAKYVQNNQVVKYKDKTYIGGYNAFDDIVSAHYDANDGATIYVINGEYYSSNYNISKNGITLIGDNATISNPIYVDKNVKGLTIEGFKFKDKANISFSEDGGIEDFTFKNNIIYGSTFTSNTGFLSFSTYNTNVNKNFEIINNKFFINKNLINNTTGFINGGDIMNITIAGNYIEGKKSCYIDAIKLDGNYQNSSEVGSTGIVKINNNYFNNIGNIAIFINKYSASLIEINNNIFDSCGDTYHGGAIRLDSWKDSLGTKINIKYNVIKNTDATFGIRFDNSTMDKDAPWRVNIHFNKFINYKNSSNRTGQFIIGYSLSAQNLINANDNYFDSPYTDRIVNVGKFNIQFETEEDLDNYIFLESFIN